MPRRLSFLFIALLVLSACSSRHALLRKDRGSLSDEPVPPVGIPFDRDKAKQLVTYDDRDFLSPDYNYFISLFDKNISIYNQISDSVFVKAPKEEWVSTFLRRARLASSLCQWNQEAIDYFLPHLFQDSVPEGFERHLYEQFTGSSIEQDDFIYEEIILRLNSLLEDVKDRGDDEMSMFLNNKYQLATSRHITSISGDNNAFFDTYHHLREITDDYVPGVNVANSPENTTVFFDACSYLIEHREFIRYGMWDVPEALDFGQHVKGLVDDPVISKNLSESLRKSVLRAVGSQEFGILRNVYMPDTTHLYDQVRDSLQLVYLRRFDEIPGYENSLSSTEKRRLAIMRYRSNQISALEALKVCEESETHLNIEDADSITPRQLSEQLSSILDCIYCVDVSDLTFEQKRSRVRAYRNKIFQLLTLMGGSDRMVNIIPTLSHVATYSRLHKYLYTAERKQVLETLLFYSQPFTCAHSETVTRLALVILRGVIDYQPELLLGMLGYDSVQQLQQRPDRLISFFTDGARYHDLGKTRMPDIIRNDYRKLTDHEFAIIKLHPELGLAYLQIDPSLMELHDIVLGHHKWYDGKGGYPAYFDNTKSPYHVLIDILTLADCIEAATARLGRNYRKNKTYDDVLREFKDQAGTRYNPVLVQLLEDHEDVSSQLREISAKGWEEIYYNVFSVQSALPK